MKSTTTEEGKRPLQFNRGNPESPAPVSIDDRDLNDDDRTQVPDVESNEDSIMDENKKEDVRKKKSTKEGKKEEDEKVRFLET
jgi:hypothetical protein